MRISIKSIAGRALFIILAIALFFASVVVFKINAAGKTAKTSIQKKSEKSLFITGVVLAFSGIVSFSFAFAKKKEWNKENEVIKLTGNKINKLPEVNVRIKKFRIEPVTENSIYKCIKTDIFYQGEKEKLTIYFLDEGDYDKIGNAKEINVSGQLKDDIWNLVIHDAKLINKASKIVA